jgi:hypothetical protein
MPGSSNVAYTALKTDKTNEYSTDTQEGAANPASDEDPGELTRAPSALEEKKREYMKICKQADQVPEYAAILKNATVVEDVPNDCWGALIFMSVKDFPDLRFGRAVLEGKVRVFFILLMFFVNMFIQIQLLRIICQLLMMPDILKAQDLYKFFHDKAYEEGQLQPNAFEELSEYNKNHLCGMALSQRLFVRIIVFLWVTNNVGEIRDNWSKTVAIFGLPFLPEGMDTRLQVRDLSDRGEDGVGDLCVVCLNMRGRLILLGLVFIPKFVIAIVLSLTGVFWLMATESISDLILNSLALAFVVKVDELLAQVFFPTKLQKNIETLCIMMPPREAANDDEEMMQNVWDYVYLGITFVAVVSLVHLAISFQFIIPNWQDDVTEPCKAYLESKVPWCMPWNTDCFPVD